MSGRSRKTRPSGKAPSRKAPAPHIPSPPPVAGPSRLPEAKKARSGRQTKVTEAVADDEPGPVFLKRPVGGVERDRSAVSGRGRRVGDGVGKVG